MNKLIRFSCIFSLLVFTLSACVDQDFDNPPSEPNLPDITPNTTIEELKEKHIIGEFEEITEDLIIKGTVISDDQPGNFFRKLQIQDETGGIELAIDATELHNEYPVGREIFVKCQGLTLGDFAGFIQLGLGTVPSGTFTNTGRIPELVLDQYIVKGAKGNPIAGKVVTIDDLVADPYDINLGALITLENVEFAASSAGETYAIGGTDPQTVNLDITDCDDNTIILRTSGFSDFANQIVPDGNGRLTAVYTLFNSTRQLVIRDTNDVEFLTDPCTRSTGSGGSGSGTVQPISSIRSAFSGTDTNVSAETKIKGIVTSDRSTNNTNSQNIVIQDASAGIVVRFTGDHSFDRGDELEINVSNAELSEFRGLLQINNMSLNAVEVLQSGFTVTPEVKTVAEVEADFENIESSLVKFEGVQLSGSAVFGGTLTLSDATGTLEIFTFNSATFASQPVPTGVVDVTAIVSQFNDTRQLVLRDADDVEGGMTGGPTEEIEIADLRAMFSGSAVAAPADKKIRGIVISDAANENITGQNLVLQGANGAGIVVRFSDPHNFILGDELEVELIGAELSDFNGLVQVNNTPLSNATKIGTGTITPREITIQDLLNQASSLESTLVKIVDVQITNSEGIYQGVSTVTDNTGSTSMFTRDAATFASSSLPAGSVNITAIVSFFNAPQVNIRSLNDVEQ